MPKYIRLLLLILILPISLQSFGQHPVPSGEVFGKNRIQYRAFEWKILKTANFEIYFYQNGQTNATLAAQYTESEFDRITEILGYTPSDRIKIFIYNTAQDLNQSNLGLGSPEDGSPKMVNLQKSRVEIAFSGNQIAFKKQLIKGVSSIYVYDMLYGGNVKEMLQNSLLLSLPDWYMDGMANYLTDEWTTESDNAMRDILLSQNLKRLSSLSGQEAGIVGQSIWHYIAQRYGKDNISNILNLTRIIRNDQTSIASTLGLGFSRFLKEWKDFYQSAASQVATNYQDPKASFMLMGNGLDRGYKFRKIKLSPNQDFIAYTTNDNGHYTIELSNLKTAKKTTILSGGFKAIGQPTNLDVPLIAWQKNNNLATLYEDKNRVFIEIFAVDDKGNAKMKTRRELKEIDQANDLDVSEDGTMLALSASRKGQNDLFLYRINGNALIQLTNDFFDDRYPQFIGKSNSSVAFVSNRIADSLGTEKGTYKNIKNAFGIFLHDGSPKTTVVPCLKDSLRTISCLTESNNNLFFLSDEKGINNLYRFALADSTLAQLTAFKYGLKEIDVNGISGNIVYLSIQKQIEQLGLQRIALDKALDTEPTVFAFKNKTLFNNQASVRVVTIPADEHSKTPLVKDKENNGVVVGFKTPLTKGEVDTRNYTFENEVVKSIEPKKEKFSPRLNNTTQNNAIKLAKRENIKIKGPLDYENAAVFSGSDGNLTIDPLPMRGIGWKQTFSLNDLFENHLLRGGIFVTPNLRNSDWFGEYHYLSHRIDFSARIDRKTNYFENEILTQKYRFNQLLLTASYPVSVTTRLSVSPFYALSRAIDLEQVSNPDKVSEFGGAKAEVVFDNTTNMGLNMLEGTRAKIKYAYYKGLRSDQESFDRLTVDVRNYTKILDKFILATRLSYSRSGGNAPKLVSLGGMDNWIFINRDTQPISDALNPADKRDLFFTDFATNMRGFNINKQSGTNHLLLNIELHFPLAKYFHNGPVTSNFLRNLQLATFTDIGTTWSENGPFAIRYEYPISPVAGSRNYFGAAVNTFKNPFLLGYGLGVRTTIFGYYAKCDAAWGMENKDIQKPIVYLTLGYDF